MTSPEITRTEPRWFATVQVPDSPVRPAMKLGPYETREEVLRAAGEFAAEVGVSVEVAPYRAQFYRAQISTAIDLGIVEALLRRLTKEIPDAQKPCLPLDLLLDHEAQVELGKELRHALERWEAWAAARDNLGGGDGICLDGAARVRWEAETLVQPSERAQQ